MSLLDYAPDPGYTVAPARPPEIVGTTIWDDNPAAEVRQPVDNSVDVPGRPDTQSWFARLFNPTTDENQRDASQTPETRKPVTRDQGADNQGILSRIWGAMAHPLQTVEDTGASTGTAIGKGVGNAITGVMHSLLPLLIITAVVILGSLYIVASSGSVKIRA